MTIEPTPLPDNTGKGIIIFGEGEHEPSAPAPITPPITVIPYESPAETGLRSTVDINRFLGEYMLRREVVIQEDRIERNLAHGDFSLEMAGSSAGLFLVRVLTGVNTRSNGPNRLHAFSPKDLIDAAKQASATTPFSSHDAVLQIEPTPVRDGFGRTIGGEFIDMKTVLEPNRATIFREGPAIFAGQKLDPRQANTDLGFAYVTNPADGIERAYGIRILTRRIAPGTHLSNGGIADLATNAREILEVVYQEIPPGIIQEYYAQAIEHYREQRSANFELFTTTSNQAGFTEAGAIVEKLSRANPRNYSGIEEYQQFATGEKPHHGRYNPDDLQSNPLILLPYLGRTYYDHDEAKIREELPIIKQKMQEQLQAQYGEHRSVGYTYAHAFESGSDIPNVYHREDQEKWRAVLRHAIINNQYITREGEKDGAIFILDRNVPGLVYTYSEGHMRTTAQVHLLDERFVHRVIDELKVEEQTLRVAGSLRGLATEQTGDHIELNIDNDFIWDTDAITLSETGITINPNAEIIIDGRLVTAPAGETVIEAFEGGKVIGVDDKALYLFRYGEKTYAVEADQAETAITRLCDALQEYDPAAAEQIRLEFDIARPFLQNTLERIVDRVTHQRTQIHAQQTLHTEQTAHADTLKELKATENAIEVLENDLAKEEAAHRQTTEKLRIAQAETGDYETALQYAIESQIRSQNIADFFAHFSGQNASRIHLYDKKKNDITIGISSPRKTATADIEPHQTHPFANPTLIATQHAYIHRHQSQRPNESHEGFSYTIYQIDHARNTFINGERLIPGTEVNPSRGHALHNGDIVQFGDRNQPPLVFIGNQLIRLAADLSTNPLVRTEQIRRISEILRFMEPEDIKRLKLLK